MLMVPQMIEDARHRTGTVTELLWLHSSVGPNCRWLGSLSDSSSVSSFEIFERGLEISHDIDEGRRFSELEHSWSCYRSLAWLAWCVLPSDLSSSRCFLVLQRLVRRYHTAASSFCPHIAPPRLTKESSPSKDVPCCRDRRSEPGSSYVKGALRPSHMDGHTLRKWSEFPALFIVLPYRTDIWHETSRKKLRD